MRSWDNLTNKGLLRDAPDQVLVWNDLQKREAVELHGVRPERVVVTGAPAYDHWFDWQPSADARGALRRSRARPGAARSCSTSARPSSSPPTSPRSSAAGSRRCARAAGRSRDAGLLVRPHPLAAPGSATCGIDDPQVAIWPRARRVPAGGRGAAELLRLDLPQRRRRRDQHERADRGGDRRPARCTRSSPPSSPTPRPERSTSATWPTTSSATCTRPRTLEEHAGAAGAGRRRRGAERSERALPAPVRPPVRARRGRRPRWPSTRSRSSARAGPLPPARARGRAGRSARRSGPLAARAAAERRRQKQARSGLEPLGGAEGGGAQAGRGRPGDGDRRRALARQRDPRAPLLDPVPALGARSRCRSSAAGSRSPRAPRPSTGTRVSTLASSPSRRARTCDGAGGAGGRPPRARAGRAARANARRHRPVRPSPRPPPPVRPLPTARRGRAVRGRRRRRFLRPRPSTGRSRAWSARPGPSVIVRSARLRRLVRSRRLRRGPRRAPGRRRRAGSGGRGRTSACSPAWRQGPYGAVLVGLGRRARAVRAARPRAVARRSNVRILFVAAPRRA